MRKRWKATAYYRTEAIPSGIIDVPLEFEEIEELSELVERGPDWRSLERIEIRLALHETEPDEKITMEEALRQ